MCPVFGHIHTAARLPSNEDESSPWLFQHVRARAECDVRARASTRVFVCEKESVEKLSFTHLRCICLQEGENELLSVTGVEPVDYQRKRQKK